MPDGKMEITPLEGKRLFFVGIIRVMGTTMKAEERWDRDMVQRRFRALMNDWFWNNFNLKPFLRGYKSAEKPVMDMPFDWGTKMNKQEAMNYAAVKRIFEEWLNASCKIIDQMFDSIAVDRGAKEDW